MQIKSEMNHSDNNGYGDSVVVESSDDGDHNKNSDGVVFNCNGDGNDKEYGSGIVVEDDGVIKDSRTYDGGVTKDSGVNDDRIISDSNVDDDGVINDSGVDDVVFAKKENEKWNWWFCESKGYRIQLKNTLQCQRCPMQGMMHDAMIRWT